ncbi:MAG TPA: hypothetical protein IAB45_04300 [Candidatus Onthousia faecavium]|nr:hypothetical protein [Candidatus Onthousia faecavium]
MTEQDMLNEHKRIFISASGELVNNNTNSLIEDDVITGIIDPPLEAMDIIKSRFLSVAKANNLILKTDVLNQLLSNYKDKLKEKFIKIGDKRKKFVSKHIEKIEDDKSLNLVKELKKELVKFDKEIKKESKELVLDLINKELVSKIDNINSEIEPKYKKEMIRFLQVTYVKQFLELLEMKLIVKDTILLNSLKEYLDRFIFTTENSHLFD